MPLGLFNGLQHEIESRHTGKQKSESLWFITSLSIGKDTGIVALEGVVEKTFPKALEDHLLTWTHTHTHNIVYTISQ